MRTISTPWGASCRCPPRGGVALSVRGRPRFPAGGEAARDAVADGRSAVRVRPASPSCALRSGRLRECHGGDPWTVSGAPGQLGRRYRRSSATSVVTLQSCLLHFPVLRTQTCHVPFPTQSLAQT